MRPFLAVRASVHEENGIDTNVCIPHNKIFKIYEILSKKCLKICSYS